MLPTETADGFYPPYRDLTEEERVRFAEDGVACVRDCVDPSWLAPLAGMIERQLRHPSPIAGDSNPGASANRSFSDRYLWPTHPDFHAFNVESGLAGLAAQAMGSTTARLYFDHIFVKEPGTPQGTPWHQDLPYWPFRGEQICTIWLALTDISAASSALRFVKGSHVWNRWFRPEPLSARIEWVDENQGEPMPDFDDGRYTFLEFRLSPGDALIFSPSIVHGSGANRSEIERRVAFATRWLGDDAVWDPRPGTDPIVGPEDVALAAGDPAHDDRRFPLVWQGVTP